MAIGANRYLQRKLKVAVQRAISREELELAQSYREYLEVKALGDSLLATRLRRRGKAAQKKLEDLRKLLTRLDSQLGVSKKDIKLVRKLTTRWRQPAKPVAPKESRSRVPISSFYEKSIPGDYSVGGGLVRPR